MNITKMEDFHVCLNCKRISVDKLGELNYCPYCGKRRSSLSQNISGFLVGLDLLMPYVYAAMMLVIFLWVIM